MRRRPEVLILAGLLLVAGLCGVTLALQLSAMHRRAARYEAERREHDAGRAAQGQVQLRLWARAAVERALAQRQEDLRADRPPRSGVDQVLTHAGPSMAPARFEARLEDLPGGEVRVVARAEQEGLEPVTLTVRARVSAERVDVLEDPTSPR